MTDTEKPKVNWVAGIINDYIINGGFEGSTKKGIVEDLRELSQQIFKVSETKIEEAEKRGKTEVIKQAFNDGIEYQKLISRKRRIALTEAELIKIMWLEDTYKINEDTNEPKSV